MAKDPRVPENSQPDEAPRSDAAPTYSVGYGRPPLHSLFKRGHVKRGGRQKGQRNIRTVLKRMLNEKIPVREGARIRLLSKRDALHLRIINDALAGKEKAQAKVIALMQLHGLNGEPHEATNEEPITADDEAVIADFIHRHMGVELLESTETPETGEAELPGEKTRS